MHTTWHSPQVLFLLFPSQLLDRAIAQVGALDILSRLNAEVEVTISTARVKARLHFPSLERDEENGRDAIVA